MKNRILGKSGPIISEIGLGCWQLGGDWGDPLSEEFLIEKDDPVFKEHLNPNDIKSMVVLKDAASTAIYGSRGGNGVILISTKDGKDGKTKFTYNGFTGIKEARQSDSYNF